MLVAVSGGYCFVIFVPRCCCLSVSFRPVVQGQEAGAGPRRAGCWLSALCCSPPSHSCHLHSTDTPEVCEVPETVGSASVSMTAAVRELEDGEDEDEDEAAAAPAGIEEIHG